MRLVVLSIAALLLPAGASFADAPPSAEERASVMAALAAVGCSDPREIEREEDDGVLEGYEVEDAKCADGVYDFDLDVNFNITDRDRED
ncbi:MAG: hypothetical protein Q7V15_07925 [Phenylobacterium sp.]|uniref:hypothetical protein n=1 Tax=Phenylobacterium sp. TaxID=1871053 RepID=UPI00271945B4|nr:hypothetical protein [Phenylobacterium sp.]MDO8901266.1 hypothetical protein [Phenylobacterium sp.]MDP2214963.1 hypothetical protein [Phenylobacterium sp.]